MSTSMPTGITCTDDARRSPGPVEFGFNAQVADNADSIVLDYTVGIGSPPDVPMPAPGISRTETRFAKTPKR